MIHLSKIIIFHSEFNAHAFMYTYFEKNLY